MLLIRLGHWDVACDNQAFYWSKHTWMRVNSVSWSSFRYLLVFDKWWLTWILSSEGIIRISWAWIMNYDRLWSQLQGSFSIIISWCKRFCFDWWQFRVAYSHLNRFIKISHSDRKNFLFISKPVDTAHFPMLKQVREKTLSLDIVKVHLILWVWSNLQWKVIV